MDRRSTATSLVAVTPRAAFVLGVYAAMPFALWQGGLVVSAVLYLAGAPLVAAPFLLAAYAGIAAILFFIPAALGGVGIVAAALAWRRGGRPRPTRLVAGFVLSVAALVADVAIAGRFHAGS